MHDPPLPRGQLLRLEVGRQLIKLSSLQAIVNL
jgi:hypothetical protein